MLSLCGWESTLARASLRTELTSIPAFFTPQKLLITDRFIFRRNVNPPAKHHQRYQSHLQKKDELQAHVCPAALRGQGAFSSCICKSLLTTDDTDAASDEVYVATIDLNVPAGPPRWIAAAGKRLLPSLFRHSMTIIKTTSGQCILFDFRPLSPENQGVAIRVISGQPVPGFVQERMLPSLPSRNCWRIGPCLHSQGPGAARAFNEQWGTELQLFKHDCKHHTDELVELLTGCPCVLSGQLSKENHRFFQFLA